MLRVKKNDIVMVTSGKDRGKSGKVLEVFKGESRALIEGINLAKKHMRPTRDNQKGGIVKIERPVSLGSIMPLCKACNRPVKIAFSISADKTKIRICKKCKQPI